MNGRKKKVVIILFESNKIQENRAKVTHMDPWRALTSGKRASRDPNWFLGRAGVRDLLPGVCSFWRFLGPKEVLLMNYRGLLGNNFAKLLFVGTR